MFIFYIGVEILEISNWVDKCYACNFALWQNCNFPYRQIFIVAK